MIRQRWEGKNPHRIFRSRSADLPDSPSDNLALPFGGQTTGPPATRTDYVTLDFIFSLLKITEENVASPPVVGRYDHSLGALLDYVC